MCIILSSTEVAGGQIVRQILKYELFIRMRPASTEGVLRFEAVPTIDGVR